MKKYLGAAIATVLLVGAAYAAAPSVPATPPAAGATAGGGAAATFTLQTADASKLKDWIVAQKPTAAPAPAGFNVAVGATLPMSIELHAIPASAGVTAVGSNQYAMVGEKIVLVSPADRKIIYVFS